MTLRVCYVEMMTVSDRLSWVRIQGFRSVEDVTVHLNGLQVMIGENGAGKSTIVEAFEVLSKVVTEGRFAVEIANQHGSALPLINLRCAAWLIVGPPRCGFLRSRSAPIHAAVSTS